MRPWISKEDAKRAAKTIAIAFEETQGNPPKTLIEATQKTIDAMLDNFPGLVREFYEQLAQTCPQALKYFK